MSLHDNDLFKDRTDINVPELDDTQKMWDGGIVEKIYGGYGSRYDEEQFIIAICDNCIEEKFHRT